LLIPVILIMAAAYLIGAIPFGYLVARAHGIDIFKVGSGNVGATNVGRVLGRRFGLLVFVLDFAKGALPAWLAGWIYTHIGNSNSESLGREGVPVLAGLAAILGHMFPVYLRFRGGKGMATGAGVVALLLPLQALGSLVVWIGLVSATRIVSVASVGAAIGLFLIHLIVSAQPWAVNQRLLTGFCLAASALVLVRHRSNLIRLLHGSENRVDVLNMLRFTKTLHVMALGLSFGSAFFFTLAAGVIFHNFEQLAVDETRRPSWLASDNWTSEHSTQLAGIAVGPLFDWYFPMQAICAFLALATALGWSGVEASGTLHKARCLVLCLAFLTVLTGWPLARYVGRLRADRYAADTTVAKSAQESFARWHPYSLLLNFGTLMLVTAGMGLAAHLPGVNRAVDNRASTKE
jgi:acyl-phosphate glycerol 3-phosphate acyltransferase